MKRYRNIALALACVFAATAAMATGRQERDEVNNSASNRSANWNWNHNHNRNRNTNVNTHRQGQSQQAVGVGVGHGGSVSNSGNNTGNSSATNQTTIHGDQAPPRAPVASAIAPALTSGADTCMGSTTVGAQGVGVGLSFGNTWTDDNCVMLKNSTMLWNMNKPDAAIALLCTNPQIRKALEVSGTECPAGRKPVVSDSGVAPAVMHAPPMPASYERQIEPQIEPPISARNRKDKG